MSSARLTRRDGFKPKLIALSVAACFSVSATQSSANPTGGTVASGSASFASSGNTLTVTNTANAIINWQNFSIGVNEITRFLQSSGSSAVLNRVVGVNGAIPQSVIDGILSSNGRVFLLNSSGIAIGATARIDVAGFVASSLNLSDADFLAGRMRFTETPGAGKVSNAGVIDTTSGGPGGRVFLVGPDVQNSGVIRSPQGEIILAAGKSVELVSENSPFVTVNLTADSEQALNVGQLLADSGRIGMFGALVRQSGVAQANSAVVGANGEIRLVATKDLTLDAGSVTTANGPSGGNVTLQAQGGTNLVYGTVEAKGSAGQGGTIEALGVRVGVIGNGVIDASGDTGGGTVLVGGDQHGANPNIQNAQQTLIGPDGVIRADAGTTGDGGRVIVWSDAETRVFGSVSARGGAQSGNGGLVETSSKGNLDVNSARIDTRAPNGQWGTWLLDPTDVIIEPNAYAGGDALVYASSFGIQPPVGTTAHITEQVVETGFATNGTVQIQATNDVGFRTDLTLVYSGSISGLFEVRAQNNIDMAYGGTGPHTITTNGNVVLSANDIGPYGAAPGLNTVSGTGSILGGGNIFADYGGVPGGNITLSGYGVTVGTLETMGGLNRVQVGNISITALGGGVQTGNITTRGSAGADFSNVGQPTAPTAGGNAGNVDISAAYGQVVTGNIDARGGSGGNGGNATGVVYAGAAGGSGSLVNIGSFVTYGSTASITTGSITTHGGAGGVGGSGANTFVYATTPVDIGSGGSGGSGGTVSLTAGNVTTTTIDVSGGSGGAGGSNNSATVYGGTDGTFSGIGTLTVGGGGDGGSGAQVTLNANSITTGSITASGGAGGAGGSGNAAVTIVNGAPANIAQASGTADAGSGGFGGGGGFVQLNGMGPVSVGGAIVALGGAGGAGGASNKADASVYGSVNATNVFADATSGFGGDGSNGGFVNITGTNISTGAISTGSGAGGAGGNNSNAQAYASSLVAAGSFFQATSDAGSGGDGGFGSGTVQISGGTISAGAIATAAAAGGAGGTGSSASASGYGATSFLEANFGYGGVGESGGDVLLTGTGGVSVGSIDTSGYGPGFVDIIATTGDITTGSITTRSLSPAFSGGSVTLATDTGRITVNGTIDARGSDGLGVLIDTCGDDCIGFTYGGSAGGAVSLTRTGEGDPVGGAAIQVNGSILASGGSGFSPQNAAGGAGGIGGTVLMESVYGGTGVSYGSVNVTGFIDAHGGSGGAGAVGLSGGAGGIGGTVLVEAADISIPAGLNASGGSGGSGGADAGNGAGFGGNGGVAGSVGLLAYGSVNVGDITAIGGNGGDGGATTFAAAYGGRGGDGGQGSFVDITTNLSSTSQVTAGNIVVSGGAGGKGGDAAAGYGGAGGLGGASFEVIIDPNTATVGAVTGIGGAGGSGGYGGIQGGAGGAGGSGSFVEIFGIAYGGPIAVGSIDVSGGAGGNGGGSGGPGVYGGAGGIGGAGGSVDVFGGSLNLTSGGTFTAVGGNGGAGGSGTSGFGGYGGNGGAGGFVNLFAQSAAGYGTILVLSALNTSVNGGLGGAGGATGGLSGTAGIDGTAVINGTVVSGANSSGDLVLEVNTVTQGTNQWVKTNFVPSTDELEKKEKENKQKKGAAACK